MNSIDKYQTSDKKKVIRHELILKSISVKRIIAICSIAD
jgi:hypothetical protein